MSRVLPFKAYRKIIDETKEVMQENPDATVTLLMRFTCEGIGEGDIGIRLAAEPPPFAPVGGELQAGISRHWEQVGSGECVLRIERIGRSATTTLNEQLTRTVSLLRDIEERLPDK